MRRDLPGLWTGVMLALAIGAGLAGYLASQYGAAEPQLAVTRVAVGAGEIQVAQAPDVNYLIAENRRLVELLEQRDKGQRRCGTALDQVAGENRECAKSYLQLKEENAASAREKVQLGRDKSALLSQVDSLQKQLLGFARKPSAAPARREISNDEVLAHPTYRRCDRERMQGRRLCRARGFIWRAE